MATHVRHPVLISAAQPNAWTFSALFFVESVARAALLTVMPLTAYALFGDKETVSLVYTCVSIAALGFSLTIPVLVRRLSRRWTYTLGCGLLMLCAAMLAADAPPALVVALFCRTAGAAILSITLSLYIMDNIGKRELTRSEPLRLAVATVAWGATPFIGVWLMQLHGLWAPAALSIGAAGLLVGVFWSLRLTEGGPIRAGRGPAPLQHPVRAVRRFAAQPRMRLAWLIAFARSAFWMTFFVYVPILMVEGGLDARAAGIAAAAGNLMLFSNVFTRGLAARFSLRRVLGVFFVINALLVLVAAGFSSGHPALAGAAMVAGALCAAMLDGLGPVPFLRAVRPHERPQMTTIYRTYLDASELIPPLVYFFVFMAFGFAGAFVVLAALLAATGALCLRHLPRGM